MPVKRRPRRDPDEEPEEEAPRSRRRARDEEEEEPEEERPRRSRRPRDDEEEGAEEDRPRRSRAREDEDEEGEEDETGKGRSRKAVARKGWGGFREGKAKAGDFPEDLRITEDHELVKFLEDEPLAVYRQHWIDSPPNGIRKKSWTCLEMGCPLCDTLGDRPRLLSVFNVLHLSTGGDPENKLLTLGVKATNQIQNIAEDKKTGPLSKLYYSISKSGKGQQTAYNFRPVKERDLEEDWELDPLTDDELDEALDGAYDDSVVQIPSKKQLQEIADALVDEDD